MSTTSPFPAPGDFSFVKDTMVKPMFEDAYKAIEVAEAWEYMKTDPGKNGYMFSQSAMLSKINSNIKYGHSGASYGWTMRQMQRLARIGWEAYVCEVIANAE
jgi:hypothetical protein